MSILIGKFRSMSIYEYLPFSVQPGLFFCRVRTLSHGTRSSNNHDFHEKAGNGNSRLLTFTGLGAITVAGLYYYAKKNVATVWAHESKENKVIFTTTEPGSFVEGLPVYSSDDVAKHCNESTGIWISYKSGVYDITRFIKMHPGTLLKKFYL